MQRPKLHMAEDLLIIFWSKENLYRYMNQQCKSRNIIHKFT